MLALVLDRPPVCLVYPVFQLPVRLSFLALLRGFIPKIRDKVCILKSNQSTERTERNFLRTCNKKVCTPKSNQGIKEKKRKENSYTQRLGTYRICYQKWIYFDLKYIISISGTLDSTGFVDKFGLLI